MRLKLNIVVHLNTIRLVNDYNEHNESDSAMGTHTNVAGLMKKLRKGKSCLDTTADYSILLV